MSSKNFGIVAHFYYPELVDTLFDQIESLSDDADVFATTSEQAAAHVIKRAETSKFSCFVIITENKGRDVLPFIYVLNNFLLEEYNIILKAHTKKSSHLTDGSKWAEVHLKYNIGDKSCFKWVSTAFDELESVGMIFHDRVSMFSDADIGNNPNMLDFAKLFGIDNLCRTKWDFSAGTMFYVRGAALSYLKSLNLGSDIFEDEKNQLDGTLAHSFERLFPLFIKKSGYDILSADYPTTKINDIKKAIKKITKKGLKIYSTKRKRMK
ncbi:MAG: rhamnan synthesis F family protein [Acidithiobacillus sp.]